MKVKLLLTVTFSLTKPDARSMIPVSIALSAIISIFPVLPSLAPEYILAVVVLMLLPASNIISPPFPVLPPDREGSVGVSDAEIILLFSVMSILFPVSWDFVSFLLQQVSKCVCVGSLNSN